MKIPEHIKHYDFKKVIVNQYVEDYDNFIEDCRVKIIHSIFLREYGLNNYINWIFLNINYGI